MHFNWNLFTTLLLVVPVIAVLIFLSGAWSKWEERRRRKKMARVEVELGLEPVDKSDPDLTERFARLRRASTNPPRIGLAWRRDEPAGRFYVMILWVDSTNGYQLQGESVLVVSPRLNLPRFGLLPKNDAAGLLPAVARRLQEYVVDRLGSVPIESHPEFDRQYDVIGEDKAAIRQFLTESRLRELARLPYRSLEAGGDMFRYSRWKTFTGVNDQCAGLSELLDEARLLCREFQAGD